MKIIPLLPQNISYKSIVCGMCCLLLSISVNAKEGFYGVSSVGYISNEMENEQQILSLDAASYKLAVGYELSPAWSVEAGYQSLGEDIIDAQALSFEDRSYEINSLFLSALGRAGNRYGELFYRIGLLRLDLNETFLADSQQCPDQSTAMAPMSNGVICQSSDSKLAGVMGLGFDFYVHHSTLLRIEIEHIKGEDKYSATSAFIGFRLNF